MNVINKNQYFPKRYKNKINLDIAREIRINIKHNRISCIACHNISEDLDVKPDIVGINANMMKIKINKCQLGLFGQPNKISQVKSTKIMPKLKSNILIKEKNEKLSCKTAWDISKKINLKKTDISVACETIGIKISSCQLGVF